VPNSQFGQSTGTLAATLDELVTLARALRAQPDRVPASLTRLEGLAQMLGYFSQPKASARVVYSDDGQPPVLVTTHCAWHDCARTWRDYDACLLNFARQGEPPLWLCRDHHPPLEDGGIQHPGYQPEEAARNALETARTAVRAKLSREEMRLINTRIGG
jgi:hypothetical protein